MGNDDDTSTRLAAMERERARLDMEWNAIAADMAASGALESVDDARAPLLLPRDLRDAIEALPAQAAVATPQHGHRLRA